MKWLTIEYIKQHSRIDYDCEDALLELYGKAAEETVMNIIDRDYDDIVAHFGKEGEIPAICSARRSARNSCTPSPTPLTCWLSLT